MEGHSLASWAAIAGSRSDRTLLFGGSSSVCMRIQKGAHLARRRPARSALEDTIVSF